MARPWRGVIEEYRELLPFGPDVRVVSLGDTAPPRRVLVAHRRGRVRGAAELALHDVLVETASSYS